jgi:DHA1 family bicyclomycin/chloramphenicol resistance-like MFS transporter
MQRTQSPLTISVVAPALWILVLIAGLPLLSESAYSPALPAMAHDLKTSAGMAENTLAIYLVGLAFGTLFWGYISDLLGRKPCILAGFGLFAAACLGCYSSTSIEMLMGFRLLQALGGSVGSVLSQAVARDAFHGPELGRVYSLVSSAMSLFPALGPLFGGWMAAHFGWPFIFIFLLLFSGMVALIVTFGLSETHPVHVRQPVSVLEVTHRFFKDRKVLVCIALIGLGNGIGFSWFSEGAFFLIESLTLSKVQYGSSFLLTAGGGALGGILSGMLQKKHTGDRVLGIGIRILFLSTLVFCSCVLCHVYLMPFSRFWMIGITLAARMINILGMVMAIGNILAIALQEYRGCIGIASSLFGFSYYILISLFTYGMSVLHNGTLLPMPLYFLGLSTAMMVLYTWGFPKQKT